MIIGAIFEELRTETQLKEKKMNNVDQMPTNGCDCCGKYAELPQGEKRKRLRWSGSEWLCAACLKEEELGES